MKYGQSSEDRSAINNHNSISVHVMIAMNTSMLNRAFWEVNCSKLINRNFRIPTIRHWRAILSRHRIKVYVRHSRRTTPCEMEQSHEKTNKNEKIEQLIMNEKLWVPSNLFHGDFTCSASALEISEAFTPITPIKVIFYVLLSWKSW